MSCRPTSPAYCPPVNSDVIRQGQTTASSSLLPVSRLAPLMRDREHRYVISCDLVPNGVREVPEVIEMHPLIVPRAVGCCPFETIDGVGHFAAECIGGYRALLELPEEGLAHVRFRVRKYGDGDSPHWELNRCLTSDQGTARTLPARSSSRRRLISARQDWRGGDIREVLDAWDPRVSHGRASFQLCWQRSHC